MIPDAVIRGAWRGDLDGSLLDIVSRSTDAAAWDQAIKLASAWPGATYQVDGKQSAMPVNLDGLRSDEGLQVGQISIAVGDCQINCHYFDVDEIEFDLDPRDVTSDSVARNVLEFVQALARAINRVVLLTPESLHDRPLLSFDPGTSRWT